MLRRILFSALAIVALVGLGGLAWLPTDLAPRVAAQSEPEPPSPESKLIASEAGFFVSFRPADFTSDEVLKAAFMGLDKEMERGFKMPLSDVERVSLVVVPGGEVTLIHTHKAYDKDKLKTAFTEDRFGFEAPRPKDAPPPKREIQEKKAGTKTIYYVGAWQPYTRGFCPVDKTNFAFGEVTALEEFFKGKGKSSPDMAEAVALTGKHSLVLGLDGKRFAAAIKKGRGDRDRHFREEKRFEKFEDKEINYRQEKDRAKKEDKEEEVDVDDLFGDGPGGMMIMFLPFRPLLKAKFCLLTFDAKKTYTLKAKATARDKEDVEDLETAMKMSLYVLRDFAVLLPKQEFGETKYLQPLSAPVSKAFKAAKIEQKGNVLSTTVTMTPDAALAKKMKEAEQEQKKQREERFKDKRDFKDFEKK